MTLIQTLIVAFSMFSALPVPFVEWNDRNRRYALCAFPLVGALIGGLCWGWVALCDWLALPALLRAAGLCLLPVMVTGGIHLDGYADTCDALASHAGPDRMRQILKDPHTGAFAVIRLCGYFVASFALWGALPVWRGWAVLGLFCLSRTLSALALVAFPLAPGTGLAAGFVQAAAVGRVRAVLWVLAALLSALTLWQGGGLAVPAAWILWLLYKRTARVRFGGVSGDLAGWFLQKAEVWMLAGLVATALLEERLPPLLGL